MGMISSHVTTLVILSMIIKALKSKNYMGMKFAIDKLREPVNLKCHANRFFTLLSISERGKKCCV